MNFFKSLFGFFELLWRIHYERVQDRRKASLQKIQCQLNEIWREYEAICNGQDV